MDEPTINEDGTKTCPECAEHVQGAALVCRFCGHRFAGKSPEPVPEAATSGVAIASFITSLVGLWIAAIPLGIHARRQIDRSEGRKTGRGFATAGVVIGWLGLAGTIIVIALLVSAADSATDAREHVQQTQLRENLEAEKRQQEVLKQQKEQTHQQYCAEHPHASEEIAPDGTPWVQCTEESESGG